MTDGNKPLGKPSPKPVAGPQKAAKKAAKKKLPIPAIRPREPLTKKARAAIDSYVHHKVTASGKLVSYDQGITWTLEAERMSREQLYAWLQERGYRWRNKRWVPPRGRPPQQQPLSILDLLHASRPEYD